MSHVQYMDELVREYLLFRGFTATLKSFDNELKIDKDKGFRVSWLVLLDHMHWYSSNHALHRLTELLIISCS